MSTWGDSLVARGYFRVPLLPIGLLIWTGSKIQSRHGVESDSAESRHDLAVRETYTVHVESSLREPTKEDHLGLLIGLREAVQHKPLMGTRLGV